eukprot:COSAG01_NODE_4423_length_5036_cov_22.765445_3_plen_80_part_00
MWLSELPARVAARLPALAQPVDVYAKWIDENEAANDGSATDEDGEEDDEWTTDDRRKESGTGGAGDTVGDADLEEDLEL